MMIFIRDTNIGLATSCIFLVILFLTFIYFITYNTYKAGKIKKQLTNFIIETSWKEILELKNNGLFTQVKLRDLQK